MNQDDFPPPPDNPRSAARQRTAQALYEWQYTGQPAELIEDYFAEQGQLRGVERNFFRELLRGVIANREDLDRQLAPLLDRTIEELDPVARAVLWMGMYEIIHRLDIPWRVSINEAVELAKLFGPEKSHRYINNVLDRFARARRPDARKPQQTR